MERSRSRSRSRDRQRISRSRSRERYQSRSRSRERSYHSRRRHSRSWSQSRSRSPRHHRRSRSPYDRHSGHVDSEAQSFICTVANKVREHGQQFEDVLRDRENGKPKFSFLWDVKVSTDNALIETRIYVLWFWKSPEHRFYRSLLQSSRHIDVGFIDEVCPSRRGKFVCHLLFVCRDTIRYIRLILRRSLRKNVVEKDA